MVKSYLRYERDRSFGVIASLDGNVIYDKTGRLAISPALKDIVVWNIRQGNKVAELRGESGQVTTLCLSPCGAFVAAGYSNGIIRIFKLATSTLEVTLDGHKSDVETLCYKANGSVLASGSRDTDIIVWDIVSQSGLFRLKGHKDAVTSLKFIENDQYLVSSSKDTLLKVWDLDTQHCLQTCVGHRNEVWSFDVSHTQQRLITGASDNQMRVWSLRNTENDDASEETHEEIIKLHGVVHRQSNDRALSVQYNPNGTLVGCQSAGKTLEIYKIRSQEEMKKKKQRREKRAREKARKKHQQSTSEASLPQEDNKGDDREEEEEEEETNAASDELELLCVVRSASKIKSFCFSPDIAKDGSTSLLLGLQNNSIETYTLHPHNDAMDARFSKSHALTLSGHRSDVRAVHISSDDQLVLSLASTSVKIWNAKSMQCVRTLSDGLASALCAAFVPGNMHVVVGTKSGSLMVFDLNSGDIIWQEDNAHNGSAIWSIDVRPDGKGLATGGADQHVNFWDFEMIQTDEKGGLRLGLSHSRMLKMSDDVLCVRYSNTRDAKKLLIAVALLDCTVKVFHDDSLKFFVSLYGHKLPVMAMDISSDDTMLVTASADKNVKLWGLDFGDCHKSIFAHSDSIMSVKFVHKTHYFFTASKDKTLGYWDGDHFERILKMDQNHFGQIWGVAVAKDGSFVVSCGSDRSLCRYIRTEDQVFIEEEKEKELETLFEEELNNTNNKSNKEEKESASAAKKTVEAVQAGERLMEALELAEHELKAMAEHEKAQKRLQKEKKSENKEKEPVPVPQHRPNIMLLGYTPMKYVLYTLRRIKAHELEEALMVLPFDYVPRLVTFLLQLISSQLEVEFCCNCLLFLLKLHQTQIVSNGAMLGDLDLLWTRLRRQLVTNKNRIGFNLAGMKYLKRQMDEERTGYVQEIAPTITKKRKTTQ